MQPALPVQATAIAGVSTKRWREPSRGGGLTSERSRVAKRRRRLRSMVLATAGHPTPHTGLCLLAATYSPMYVHVKSQTPFRHIKQNVSCSWRMCLATDMNWQAGRQFVAGTGTVQQGREQSQTTLTCLHCSPGLELQRSGRQSRSTQAL